MVQIAVVVKWAVLQAKLNRWKSEPDKKLTSSWAVHWRNPEEWIEQKQRVGARSGGLGELAGAAGRRGFISSRTREADRKMPQ